MTVRRYVRVDSMERKLQAVVVHASSPELTVEFTVSAHQAPQFEQRLTVTVEWEDP